MLLVEHFQPHRSPHPEDSGLINLYLQKLGTAGFGENDSEIGSRSVVSNSATDGL